MADQERDHRAAGLTGEESPGAARGKIRSLVANARDSDLIVDRVADAVGLAESVSGGRGTPWAIGRFFEELARRRPLVVVFDDIHWGERTFLDLVETLAAKSCDAPILLLCMARPDLLELRPAWGERASGATRLLLAPLSEDASERLVTNLLGPSEFLSDVRRRITAATEGNPLFVEEVVAMLVDEGSIQDGSPISLPPTIQALLGARLDRLAREDRAVLERGSVEGKAFHLGAVVELSPAAERPQVEERLSRLLEREFLDQPPGFVGERAYRFHHQLFATSLTSRCPRLLARSCTSASPTGSRPRPQIVLRSSTKFWVTTCSWRMPTSPTSARSTSTASSSPRRRRATSAALEHVPTLVVTWLERATCSPGHSCCCPRTPWLGRSWCVSSTTRASSLGSGGLGG